jgi:hypothetical protein
LYINLFNDKNRPRSLEIPYHVSAARILAQSCRATLNHRYLRITPSRALPTLILSGSPLRLVQSAAM